MKRVNWHVPEVSWRQRVAHPMCIRHGMNSGLGSQYSIRWMVDWTRPMESAAVVVGLCQAARARCGRPRLVDRCSPGARAERAGLGRASSVSARAPGLSPPDDARRSRRYRTKMDRPAFSLQFARFHPCAARPDIFHPRGTRAPRHLRLVPARYQTE